MVRCKDCGLIGLRRQDSQLIDECSYSWRNIGGFTEYESRSKQYVITPICLARQEKFSHERSEILQKINEDRKCEKFLEWEQGFTPKEHKEFEMERIEQLERRLFEEKIARDARTSELRAAIWGGIAGALITLVGMIVQQYIDLILKSQIIR